jgi:dienelactone hydrolase
MALYLYVPAAASPPFQTVIYWPGWDTFRLSSVDEYFAKQADFLVKSGRAVAFPMYQGTFERGDGSGRPPFNTTAYRDNTIEGVKDLRRTIDYLETRREIDTRSIAFYGYSWGGVNGSVALAHEPRLRTAIIYVGLIPRLDATPEIDPVSALPRVRVPLLMFSGEFDAMVPLENARQYFGLVGSPAGRKRHVVAPAGHFVPRSMLIRETLDWLDRYQVRPGA